MDEDLRQKREALIVAALEDAVFEGWRWESVLASAARVGIGEDMARALFPGRLADVLDGLSDWADRSLLAALAEVDPATLKVRERIRLGVMKRLEILTPHKEAMREAYSFWSSPLEVPRAARILWRTADRIWVWAGDTATDYNHYTKRGLLSGILAAVSLVWLNDSDPSHTRTLDFLDRRIENVLEAGRFLSRIIPGKKAS